MVRNLAIQEGDLNLEKTDRSSFYEKNLTNMGMAVENWKSRLNTWVGRADLKTVPHHKVKKGIENCTKMKSIVNEVDFMAWGGFIEWESQISVSASLWTHLYVRLATKGARSLMSGAETATKDAVKQLWYVCEIISDAIVFKSWNGHDTVN